MNIGQVARRTGLPAKTIRYYESVGLIDEPNRADNGYRRYAEAHVDTLAFVHRARDLGFSIDEIRDLLALWRDKGRASADVKRIALKQIDDIGRRIDKLESIRRTLVHLTERCHGDDRPDCPILDDLAGKL